MTLQQPLQTLPAGGDAPAAELTPYDGIRLSDIRLIVTAAQAEDALASLMRADVLGFDTESKPTFVKGEQSRGPHLIQLATDDTAYLFQVGSAFNQHAAQTVLTAPHILKVGFGLSDDLKRLHGKMGIDAQNVLDLSIALRRGGRNDIGAKTAVAQFFGMHLQKSKKTSTTNWAAPQLTERQMLYAADDAQVALRIYRAWRARQ
ncbi:3'-5' exonuclease domain-containing protein 2 [Oxalobacteraceae bacterium CAVE-383]|nr:3'-5' exonuclease domain-containing protein 2 [Oxalobacteraceae bacterium CAVE-383]